MSHNADQYSLEANVSNARIAMTPLTPPIRQLLVLQTYQYRYKPYRYPTTQLVADVIFEVQTNGAYSLFGIISLTEVKHGIPSDFLLLELLKNILFYSV